ncbi:hypothetical protein ZOSMA_197G00170 [Zostera marina]|uniref:Uncharacterized protein n=1 Tax=Zostera marina TaxID=29655 RepID=A0A0K9PNX4_ZOSMR|nr:hypothetical protein ZOSMA_197G00170 [Zostera marina]
MGPGPKKRDAERDRSGTLAPCPDDRGADPGRYAPNEVLKKLKIIAITYL